MNGDRGVDESGVGVKPEIIIMLLVFYAIFVTGDVLTTFWLIEYHPGGINGEMNPIAYMIFTSYGYLGMLVSKIIFFIVSSIVFLVLYNRYGGMKWFRDALEITLLGLTGLSILVIMNNLFSIIATSMYLYRTPPIWLLKILVFIMTVTAAELAVMIIFRDSYRVVETLIGCVVAMAPLFIWPRLDPLYYILYITSLSILVGISTYLVEGAREKALEYKT